MRKVLANPLVYTVPHTVSLELWVRWQDLIDAARRSPGNVRFRDLCGLVERLGYVLDRRRGSHRIYRHPSRSDLPLVNLQEGGNGKAKRYQVRQILGIIDTHKLGVD